MARYRQVETTFWTDGFILKLTPEEKYFYLYLLTNPHTTQCGIYELPERIAEVETGYNRETITKLRDRFSNKYRKIKYSQTTEEYCIVNWLKYNSLKSPKVKACIDKELGAIKDKSLIQYVYGMDSLSIDWGEEEEEEREREEEEEEKRREEKPKITKHKYGEYQNVLLSDIDYQKVQDEFPYNYQDRIERLSEYIASTGKTYKNHLATIRSWARKDKPEKNDILSEIIREGMKNESDRNSKNNEINPVAVQRLLQG